MQAMLTPANFLRRLDDQQDALLRLLGEPDLGNLDWSPAANVWSARENLAHLGRYHEIFRQRLATMRAEDQPALGRYRAPDDPGFAAWAALPYAELMARMTKVRGQLADDVRSLTPDELDRRGSHPLFGALPIGGWLDFFLVHEAHHHYTLLIRLHEAARHQ
jgi:hypothetical protein